VDQRQIRAGEQPVVMDVAGPASPARVYRDIYPQAQGYFDYCSDLKRPLSEPPPRRSVARSGQLTIEIRDTARATVRLEDVTFENADGSRATISPPLVIVARVGGVAG
jgi:hypothetical protein